MVSKVFDVPGADKLLDEYIENSELIINKLKLKLKEESQASKMSKDTIQKSIDLIIEFEKNKKILEKNGVDFLNSLRQEVQSNREEIAPFSQPEYVAKIPVLPE
jgi:urocanate hydratase